MAALIRDSAARMILELSENEFYYPKLSLMELEEHKTLVLNKSGLNENEYRSLLNSLLKRIRLVDSEKVAMFLGEAKEVMQRIDPDDVIFIACALSLSNSLIWSDDKHFDKQNKVKVLKTKDLMNFFEDEFS